MRSWRWWWSRRVTLRMIDQTLPLFAERLEKVLVIRERRANADVRRRRYALAGAVTLAVFVGGFTLAAWMDGDKTAAFDRCLTQSIDAQGHPSSRHHQLRGAGSCKPSSVMPFAVCCRMVESSCRRASDEVAKIS